MKKTRGFLLMTYKLYHHLDKVEGTKKSHCLNIILSMLKYAWKKDNYICHLRHATIEKDTGLSRPTVKRCLFTLAKLNIIKKGRGKSGCTYQFNTKFLRYEKESYLSEKLDLSNVKTRAILEDSIYKNTLSDLDKLIIKHNNKDTIINKICSSYTLAELNKLYDKGDNPYYVRLAIQLKKEEAKPKIDIPFGILDKVKKKTNLFYKQAVERNRRGRAKLAKTKDYLRGDSKDKR